MPRGKARGVPCQARGVTCQARGVTCQVQRRTATRRACGSEVHKTMREIDLRLDECVDESLARDRDPSLDPIEGAANRLLGGLEHIGDLGHRKLLGVVQL